MDIEEIKGLLIKAFVAFYGILLVMAIVISPLLLSAYLAHLWWK